MILKKEKPSNPKIKYPKQGLAENRYTCGSKSWAASTLVNWCKEQNYPVFKLPLAAIDLSQMPWDINNIDEFIWHSKRVNDVGDYPVILDNYGRICDGFHRVCKAIINDKTEIDAIRIEEMPRPDGIEE
jgi:hypothetical protein